VKTATKQYDIKVGGSHESPAPKGGKVTAYYRPGTSDEGVLPEVIDRHCYARRSAGFDVLPGETWLDLGANIGAFVLYARLHGAKRVDCYEPDPDCFALLEKNRGGLAGTSTMAALSNRKEKVLEFRKGRDPNDHYRATLLTNNRLPPHELGTLANRHGSTISARRYDGIKMDIEGSEFGLIDDDLLPRSEKLTMEYHFLRDGKSLDNFYRRMTKLKRRFKNVWYPAFIERDRAAGRDYSGRFDCQIFCWSAR
jgi:FkbM family methyltransferase